MMKEKRGGLEQKEHKGQEDRGILVFERTPSESSQSNSPWPILSTTADASVKMHYLMAKFSW